MKILKFGGTSLGSPRRIRVVADIVSKAKRYNDIVVVVSAFSKVTNQLIAASNLASQNDAQYRNIFQEIKLRHLSAVRELATPERAPKALEFVEDLLTELENLLHGISLVKEQSTKTLDVIMSFGERLSAYIVSEAVNAHGAPAKYLDSRPLVRTNNNFGFAQVDVKTTYKNIRKYFKKRRDLFIATGFVGSTSKKETTTLGRGGSDYTAALFGAALNVTCVEIWTDVDGFMTADPRKVPSARVISRLRYAEAAELSHFGAKVLHLRTIRPARDKEIPILIKNTLHPKMPGTSINTKPRKDGGPITGVTSITEVGLLRIQGDGMQGVSGTANRFFGALAAARVNIILITQASSEYAICVAVEEEQLDEAKEALEEEFAREIALGQIDSINIKPNCSIVAVVGENMQHTTGMSKKIFWALGNKRVNIIAIAFGSSELNISIVVDREDEIKSLRAIHNVFLSKKSR